MELSDPLCYQAVLARDARYDGVFFTCVTSTRIYCRPICPARPPKITNCRFVPSAAAAQDAGFRACLRCRPESAPDLGAWRGTSASVSRALALIEAGALDKGKVETLAARLGMGERHLRRLFSQHLGATPIAVAQTRRMNLAKQLIHQTDLSMTDIALASGFGSLRRFNECFQQLYERPPGALRRRAAKATGCGIHLFLPYRPPYHWPAMLGFLAARAMQHVESVVDGRYRRSIEIDDVAGWIEIGHAPEKHALAVSIHHPNIAALPGMIARIRRLFDLASDPVAIDAALARDERLAPLVAARPGLRVPGAWSGFETAIRAILGQQITVAAATALAGKLVAVLGRPSRSAGPFAELTHLFPAAACFTPALLDQIGMPRARRAALAGLAAASLADPFLFDPKADLETAIAQLSARPGLGPWTAHYIAMRVLRENDACLASDIVLRRILGAQGDYLSTAAVQARAEAWRPWRAYAVMHLWAADHAAPSRLKESKNAPVL